MNALLAPVVVSRTEWPEEQPVSAAWMRAVSRVVSLGTPVADTVCDAVSVVHAGGMVGWAGRAVSAAQRAPPLPASTVAPLLLLLELLLLLPPLLELLLLPVVPASLAPLLLLEPPLLEAPASWGALELEPLLLLPLDEPPELLLLETLPPELLLALLPPVTVPELDSPPPPLLLLDEPSSSPPVESPAELPHAIGPDTDKTTAKAPSHRKAVITCSLRERSSRPAARRARCQL